MRNYSIRIIKKQINRKYILRIMRINHIKIAEVFILLSSAIFAVSMLFYYLFRPAFGVFASGSIKLLISKLPTLKPAFSNSGS